MKPKTIHLWYYGDKPIYWKSPRVVDDKVVSTPVEVYFIHNEIVGDFNRKTYSRNAVKAKRGEFVCSVFFLPNPNADLKQIMMELHRGQQYFTTKEGFLFGALYELTKYGEFIKINL